MEQEKMHLINKIFNDETIRTIWNKEEEKYYISVTDIVGILSDSKDGKTYWRVLKYRLKKEGNESVTNCNALKLKSSDGKYYKTDVVDIEGMFRIIESIPSKNAEPIKQWLAKLGSERIDELFDPSLTAQRAIDTYRAKGYDETWIQKRIKGIQDRKQLTDVWQEGGITKNVEFAILTNEIYKEWSGMTAKEYKQHKNLRKESLRDNMSDIEIVLANLGEIAARDIASFEKPSGFNENVKVARRGGKVSKSARDSYEKETKISAVTSSNHLKYKYKNDNEMLLEEDKKDKEK